MLVFVLEFTFARKGYDNVDFVLGKWSTEEQKALKERCDIMVKMIYSFATQGTQIP